MIGVVCTLFLLLLVLAPAFRYARGGPTLTVRGVSTLVVRAPARVCSEYLRDARNLGDYEQKVTRCAVGPRRRDGCTYACRGWYFGVPWRATFDMRHTADGGFTSSIAAGARDVVAGGFALERLDADRTRVTHWESYRFPVWLPLLWALRGSVERWLQRSLEVEMRIVAASAERLARDGYVEPILAPHRSAVLRRTKYTLAAHLRERFGTRAAAGHRG